MANELNPYQLRIFGLVEKNSKEVFEEAIAYAAGFTMGDAKYWEKEDEKEKEIFRVFLRKFLYSLAENISPQVWNAMVIDALHHKGFYPSSFKEGLLTIVRGDVYKPAFVTDLTANLQAKARKAQQLYEQNEQSITALVENSV